MAYSEECSMCCWEEYVFCCCQVECSIDVQLLYSAQVFYFLVDLSNFFHYWKWDIEFSNYYYCWVVNFSFNSVSFTSYFGALFIGIYFYNCFNFFMNQSFYHCKISFFVSSSKFCLKVYDFLILVYSHSISLLDTICVLHLFPVLFFTSYLCLWI